MILGVGIDIVSIARIEALMIKFPGKFEAKIFTENEIAKAQKFTGKNNMILKAEYYAKRFAAKEAFSKAIGLGIGRGINFTDIQISNNENGKPEIKLSESAKSFLSNHFQKSDFNINLSLTDEPPIAQAIVIISQ